MTRWLATYRLTMTSNAFNAIFEGNGHKIKNLFIKRNTRYTGLFGYTGSADARIRNVGLEGGLIHVFYFFFLMLMQAAWWGYNRMPYSKHYATNVAILLLMMY